MAIKSFKELKKEFKRKQDIYNACEHEFEEKSCGCYAVGRFGGHTVNLYKCKKCGYEGFKEDEYKEAMSHYDNRGMPLD